MNPSILRLASTALFAALVAFGSAAQAQARKAEHPRHLG